MIEADNSLVKINELLREDLKLESNESDPYKLWAAIHYLYNTEIEGPANFQTWKEAAISERRRRFSNPN